MSSVSWRTSWRRSSRVSGVPASVSSSVTALKTWSPSAAGSSRKSSWPSLAMHAAWTAAFRSAYGSAPASAVASAPCGASPFFERRSWRPTPLSPHEGEFATRRLAHRRRGCRTCLRRKLLRDGEDRLREVATRLREDRWVTAVDGQRHGLVARELVAHLHLQCSLDLAQLQTDVRVRTVHHVPNAARRKRQ